jgi:hypothetical protein
MSKTNSLDQVIGRALRDGDFRKSLLENPEQALAGQGLSDEDLALIVAGMQSDEAASFFASDMPSMVMASSAKKCCQYP